MPPEIIPRLREPASIIGPRINELPVSRLPEISPAYLFSLELLYHSSRTNVYLDTDSGIVIKERLHQLNRSQVISEEVERIARRKLEIEREEASFYSEAFPNHTPSFLVTEGVGSQGLRTVFIAQEYVPGKMLREIENLDLTQPGIRTFWEQVLHVLRYDGRLPDLQADLPVSVLDFQKNLPDPFRTSNVILTDEPRCILVDMEEQLGHWSRSTVYGRYLICPMIASLIRDELRRQNRVTTRIFKSLVQRKRESRR